MNFGKRTVENNKYGTMTTTYSGIQIGGKPAAVLGMILAVFFFLVGIIIAAITLFSYYSDFKLKDYIKSDAKIIGNGKDSDENFSSYKISYTVNNKVYIYDDFYPFGEDNLTIGSIVTIRYNPKNPNEITSENEHTSIFFPFITLLILLSSIFSFKHNLKKFKNPNSVKDYTSFSIGIGDTIVTNGIIPNDNTHMEDSNINNINL